MAICCMYVCTPLSVRVYIQAISKLRATLSGADDDQGIVGTTTGSVNIVRNLAQILIVMCPADELRSCNPRPPEYLVLQILLSC